VGRFMQDNEGIGYNNAGRSFRVLPALIKGLQLIFDEFQNRYTATGTDFNGINAICKTVKR
jgi:hypothetical protein